MARMVPTIGMLWVAASLGMGCGFGDQGHADTWSGEPGTDADRDIPTQEDLEPTSDHPLDSPGGSETTDADHDASDCSCTTQHDCCDGCRPRSEGRRCDLPGGNPWGTCREGRCEAVPGQISELSDATMEPVTALAWSPDGRLLAATCGDESLGQGRTVVWDLASSSVLWRLPGPAWGIMFQPPDGRQVAIGSDPVVLADASDGTILSTIPGVRGPLGFSPDGTLLVASVDEGVEVRRVADGSQVRLLEHPQEVKTRRWTAAFSPDGRYVTSATGQASLGSPHGDLRVFDLEDQALSRTLDCTSMGAAFSPGGDRLLSACWYTVTLWDPATGASLWRQVETDNAISIAWSPEGGRIALGTFAGGVKLLAKPPATGSSAPLARLPLAQVRALAFSPDGQRLAAGSGTGPRVVLWDLPQDLPEP